MINFKDIVSTEYLMDGQQLLVIFKNGHEEVLEADDTKITCRRCYFWDGAACGLNKHLLDRDYEIRKCSTATKDIVWLKVE